MLVLIRNRMEYGVVQTQRIDVIDEVIGKVSERAPLRVAEVFANCFRDTLNTTLTRRDDGSIFMVTGDIPAMWLRDSTAQLTPYLHFLADEAALADLVTGILRTQLRSIAHDPYANAFNAEPNGAGHSDDLTELSPWVWERKYEIDSLAYPLQLAYDLWRITGRAEHLDADYRDAARIVLDLWRTEQEHDARSPYRFQRLEGPLSDTLVREGLGRETTPVGLTWSGFRPSDDACELGFNIPGNAFAVVELGHMAEIAREVLGDHDLAARAEALAEEIDAAILRNGTVSTDAGRILAYETDGAGRHLLMDDANVPSLLSLPLLGWCRSDDALYRDTRAFVLSAANPYYFVGSAAAGVGSPHTPAESIWPIAVAVQGLTADSPETAARLAEMLANADAGTGLMHESFHRNDATVFTRPWFSWANAMFCELVLESVGLRSYRRGVYRRADQHRAELVREGWRR